MNIKKSFVVGLRSRVIALVIGLVIALVIGLVFRPHTVAAAPGKPNEADRQAAKQHYEEGVKLYDLGHLEEAIVQFDEAYRRVPDPMLLYNLAQSHRRLNHFDKAISLYRAYLRNNPNAPNSADVEERIAAMEKGQAAPDSVVPAPTTVVAPPPEKPAATAPSPPALANPQPPAPESTQPEGSLQESAPATPESGRPGLRLSGLIAGGVGVALLGTGVIFGAQTSSLSEEARNSPIYDADKVSSAESAETLQWVFLGTGVAALATGAVLYYLGLPEETPAPAVAIVPESGACSVMVAGRF